MTSTLELIDKTTGTISAEQVVDQELTKLISNLFVYSKMLGSERESEREVIETIRNELVGIRWFVSEKLKYQPSEEKG